MDLRRGQVKLIITIGLLISTPIALAQTFAECIALRELSSELISDARRAEEKQVDAECPKDEFRKRLNNVSEWAFLPDVKARQECRNEWKETHGYIYQDLFGNKYRSAEGAKIAKSLDKLASQMETISCPTSDLKWTTGN